jgi:hypothetical protein
VRKVHWPDTAVPRILQVRLHRRAVLAGGGALALTALLPLGGCLSSSDPPSLPGATVPSRFLNDHELAALRAVVDRMIPADTDPGALAAGCAEAIDHLLAAFFTDPPFIFAGAPFSDRGGHPENRFLEFIPLDPYEAFAWRLAIEGSQGQPEREFNGPVRGLQAIYREGLARIDERAAEAGFADFASAPTPAQDLILRDSSDALVQELVATGFPHTLDAMYGAPEYGGNRDFAGWGFTAFDGDVQPRGYTDDQVVNADDPGPFDALLPPSFHDPSARGGAGA